MENPGLVGEISVGYAQSTNPVNYPRKIERILVSGNSLVDMLMQRRLINDYSSLVGGKFVNS